MGNGVLPGLGSGLCRKTWDSSSVSASDRGVEWDESDHKVPMRIEGSKASKGVGWGGVAVLSL